MFKHICAFLGALLHVYLLWYLSRSVCFGVFVHMCLLICLSTFVLSVFNKARVSIYVVSDFLSTNVFLCI